MEFLQDEIYAKCLTDLFCFYQIVFFVMVLQQLLQIQFCNILTQF